MSHAWRAHWPGSARHGAHYMPFLTNHCYSFCAFRGGIGSNAPLILFVAVEAGAARELSADPDQRSATLISGEGRRATKWCQTWS